MKKILCILIGALLFLPIFVEAKAGTTITGKGISLFANGISITIQEDAPTSGTLAEIAGFTATGTDAYVVWTEEAVTKYVGISSATDVFGGSDGSSKIVTLASTNITMNGGTIHHLYGGNLGADLTAKDGVLDDPSVVTGNVNVDVTGGTLCRLYGGGKLNTSVDGTVTINVQGVEFTPDTNTYSYLVGGVNGNGNEGSTDIVNKTIKTNAIVNKVVITFKNSTVKAFALGGGGHTKVTEATAVVGDSVGKEDTIITEVMLGGINGYVGTSDLTLNSDVKVLETFSATNRGYLNNGKLLVAGATIATLNTGATPGAFSSDGNNASATLGILEIVVNDASGITNALITPSLNKVTATQYEVYIGSLKLMNNDVENALDFKLANYTASTSIKDSNDVLILKDIKNYLIPAGVKVVLKGNLKLTTPAGFTLTNRGILENDATLVAEKSTGFDSFVNDGKIITGINGTVEGSDNIDGVLPLVLEGAGQTFDPNKEESKKTGLIVRFDGTLNTDFTAGTGKVYVDETEVSSDNFVVTSGSIIVTLKPVFLQTLGAGNHTLMLAYDDGSTATTNFATVSVNPKTGDNVIVYIIAGMISIIGSIVFISKRKLSTVK